MNIDVMTGLTSDLKLFYAWQQNGIIIYMTFKYVFDLGGKSLGLAHDSCIMHMCAAFFKNLHWFTFIFLLLYFHL
jgi:hypothetical protein